ncbi:MAG: hypothetical protein V4508_02285 [Pseudomonadota bacterium]
MGTNAIQRGDGGLAFVDDASSSEMLKVGGSGNRNMKVAKVALAGVAATTGGALFAWANPENVAIIIDRLELDITTKSTGAANGSFGTAANATTSAANLIDTYALGGTEKVVNNIDDKGTNGKSVQKMTTTQVLTGTGSATTAGLVGFAYIHYYLV